MSEAERKINYTNISMMTGISICGIVVGLLNSINVLQGFRVPSLSFPQIPGIDLTFIVVLAVVAIFAIVIAITMMFSMVGGMGMR
jgi:hypothetical protein